AGDVHAPFCGIILAYPAIDTTVEYGHMAVAHTLHSGGSQAHPAAIVVTENDVGAGVRDSQQHLKFQLPAGDQTGARNVGAVVLSCFSDINEGERCLTFEQVVERCRGKTIYHIAITS